MERRTTTPSSLTDRVARGSLTNAQHSLTARRPTVHQCTRYCSCTASAGKGAPAIRTLLSTLSLRLGLGLIRLARLSGRGLRTATVYLGRLLLPLGGFIFRWLFVKPYGAAWRYHRAFRAALPNLNLLALLRHHQVALYLTSLVAAAVVGNSIRIRSVEAEDFGQHNLLVPLLAPSTDFDDAAGDLGSPGDGSLNPPTDVPYTLNEEGAVILKPHLTTTRPGIAGRSRIEEYTVQSGDTLSSIAQRFQLNVITLLWENRLTERSVLRIGQKLNVLPTNGVTYRVGRGDTVAKIAQRFKVAPDEITSFNQLGSGLTVGSTIVIPGGRPVAPPAPPRPAQTPSAPSAPSVATRTNARLQWPTVRRRITQYFSWRHTGVDIGDARGTPVYAAEDGVVEVAGWNRGGYGYYIVIDHGGGLKTLYGHNTKLRVTVGDRVERGQQISDMGSTGRSTGPHLHFEVRVNGRRVNPLSYTR